MKRFFVWQYMINKRLLHKKIFVFLLCLIPVLVWGMSQLSEEDSGILTIALSVEDSQDKEAGKIVDKLMQEDTILQYELLDVQEARERVASGKVDCAWIFREDFNNKLISTFSQGEKVAPIYVVAQEETVVLQLARTYLYGSVFPYLSELLCEYYMENEIDGVEDITPEELQYYYEKCAVDGSVIEIIYADKQDIATQQKQSYLMAPMKGILAVLLLVSGLVVTIYYMQDDERGMFAWIPMHKRRGLLYCYLLGASIDVGVVVCISLLIMEKRMVSLYEIGVLFLYLCMSAAFCEMVKILSRTKDLLIKWILFLTLAMLIVCPIFIDLGSGFGAQYLFPPTYYLRALYHSELILVMVGYTLLVLVISKIFYKITE